MTIEVNQFHDSHHELLLMFKLQYRLIRWVRLVEAMAISHFNAGAHKCLINEFPHTRADPFERFLRWQRTNAFVLVARDVDLQRVIKKDGDHGAQTFNRKNSSTSKASTKAA